MGRLGERAAIDVDHAQLRILRRVDERPARAIAGGGDEQPHVKVARFEIEPRRFRARGEIGDERTGLHAKARLEAFRQFLERGATAGDENQRKAFTRQFGRDRAADAVGGAGYDGPRAVGGAKRSGFGLCFFHHDDCPLI